MTPAVDSIAVAEQWLAPVRLDTTSVLFVIGFADGHVVDALDRRGWTGHLIALEPEAATAADCLNRKAVRDWQRAGRLTVLAGPDYTGLDQVLSTLPLGSEKPVIAGNPEVARAHREACVHAARTVSRAWFGARANAEARRQNAGRYLLNTLRNLPLIATEGDAAALVGAFVGKPALVVAAGPSLDRNLPNIVALRNRVLVIAVDTALRPLLAAGVQPDFVVAVDPSEANACHLTDLSPCPETYFVAEGSIDPEALRPFEGRTFFFRVAGHHPWPWLRGLGLERQPLRAWGSVLTTAFDLGLQMGCGPIVFAGADLAYTDGRPYARGTTYEDSWRREQAWGSSLEETWAARLAEWPETFESGVAGVSVRTAPHLRSFRDWIVAEAGKATGRVIVNATEGGILVGDGIRQSTLVDALGSLPPLPSAIGQGITALHRTLPAVSHGALTVAADVRREWIAFASVSEESIGAALKPKPPVSVATARPAPAVPAACAPAAAAASPHPGLSDADSAYLRDLAERERVRLLVLASPGQDLLVDLRQQCDSLGQDEALVVVDEVGTSVGSQVRRAVDAILCERPDVWLEYRRFVDHASRLTVLRGGAAMTVSPDEADAAKRDPAHQVVADSLVPLIVSHLAPQSAVEVGPGAGFWLQALKSNGVAEVLGVTPVTTKVEPGQRFDVCLCLEVAQQLAPADQDALIEACSKLSDVVVFSSTPPGVPGASRHARPLHYWAEKFWRHGYALDDTLRPLIQARWDSPRTVFDCLVMFRRLPTAPDVLREWAITAASRTHDLYLQGVWWSVLAGDRSSASGPAAVAPRSERQSWTIWPSRMLSSCEALTRLFRFRTDAARWYLTHPGSDLQLFEDGCPLPMVSAVAELSSRPGGGWARWRDEITLRSSDGTDPRSNGRRYSVTLPAHVAWAESQPLLDTLNSSL